MLPRQWGVKLSGKNVPSCDDCEAPCYVDVQFVGGAGPGRLSMTLPPGWLCVAPTLPPSGPFEFLLCPGCVAKRDAKGGS